MVFSYHQIQEHPKLLLAMTGLTRTRIFSMAPPFPVRLGAVTGHDEPGRA